MDRTKLSERDLLLACFQDEAGAWDAFVNRFSKLIYHTIYQTLRAKDFPFDFQILDDVFQEVFLSLFKNQYKKLKQFKGKNNCTLASWLRIIASRSAIDFMRKQRNCVSLDDTIGRGQALGERLTNKKDRPDKNLEKRERYQLFKKMIAELAPKDRYLFELTYHQELPDKEIAQILNLSVSAVYMRKSRIKEKLKKITKKQESSLEKSMPRVY
jgi:RNA polymerase sigma-70 factor (ECF subfamily)